MKCFCQLAVIPFRRFIPLDQIENGSFFKERMSKSLCLKIILEF